ncbi:hypothetical protein HOS59_gp07 [Streptomyces phage Rowa]|uniref:Uncharacterized protein n=1 Tax=Streptomyces phage Rowa TaxID=2059883 RepID=A0A2H5BLT7_9CAUD|nr:hypothetical protein HOS59_gp07 [Streptomyces phage Rowa]AUG87272.1 hypothetical protein SEA_ROWA_7 [Streptomyces phage Rowa]
MPPKAKAVTPDLPHEEACKGPRVEEFKALSPGGSEVSVTRCQECGAQTTK